MKFFFWICLLLTGTAHAQDTLPNGTWILVSGYGDMSWPGYGKYFPSIEAACDSYGSFRSQQRGLGGTATGPLRYSSWGLINGACTIDWDLKNPSANSAEFGWLTFVPSSDPLQLTITGPTETKPKYTGNWRELMMTATVTRGGKPESGQKIFFKLTPKVANDGHSHGLNGKPSGTLDDGTTDGAGQVKAPYLPSEFSGNYIIEASCDGCTNKATLDVTVRVPDLIALEPDSQSPARYQLIGETTTHPGNHYFSEAAIKVLVGLISTFQSPKLNWGTVGINDSSLAWGGRFDIGAGWSGSHKEHREGNEVDISFNRPSGISPQLRSKTYDALKKGDRFISPQTLWHVNDSADTGSKAHFHVYLLGQKTSATVPY